MAGVSSSCFGRHSLGGKSGIALVCGSDLLSMSRPTFRSRMCWVGNCSRFKGLLIIPRSPCAGRYTTRSKEARELDLSAFVSTFVPQTASATSGFVASHPLVIDKAGKDRMVGHRFAGGGGVLTYCKADGTCLRAVKRKESYGIYSLLAAACEIRRLPIDRRILIDCALRCVRPAGVFVHTANTESGLCRKLEALAVDPGQLTADPIAQVRRSTQCYTQGRRPFMSS